MIRITTNCETLRLSVNSFFRIHSHTSSSFIVRRKLNFFSSKLEEFKEILYWLKKSQFIQHQHQKNRPKITYLRFVPFLNRNWIYFTSNQRNGICVIKSRAERFCISPRHIMLIYYSLS